MRYVILGALAALALNAPARAAGNHLRGDYLEVRTASVFAGACHFGGEVTTTGQDAHMAWQVRSGAWNGVALDGVAAAASVSAEANLSNESAARRCVLYIDTAASAAQADALAAALTARYADALGRVVAVKRAPVRFQHTGDRFTVAVPGVSRAVVDALPDRACCTQPNLVWYKPLIPLEDRRVGYTRASRLADKTLGTEWTKNGQNSAFYGAFRL